MKLIDILARELKEWPEMKEGGTYLCQDSDNGLIEDSGTINIVILSERACDAETARIFKSDWQAAVDALDQSELDAVLAKNEQLAAARAERIPVWNGEGLPPVGLDVEIKRGNCTWIDGDEWQIGKTATVMASFLNSRDIEMASVQFPGGRCECILARCLSPIRTAEQVAAEEREKAIKDMMEVTSDGISCIGQDDALALYKAGYRKEKKPCGF